MEKQQKITEEKPLEQINDKIDQESTTQEKEEKEDNVENIIKELNEKNEVLQDKLLRQLAESENIRTRSAKLIDEAREYAIFDFTKDLMPVMDNLQRALEHLPEDSNDEVKNIIEGIKMTKVQLESVFKKHHLESIEPHPGDKFDYNTHHAISQVVTEEFEAGTIVDTMQIGYRIKNRLIRPAAVAVAKTLKN